MNLDDFHPHLVQMPQKKPHFMGLSFSLKPKNINVLRTPKPYKTKAFKSICRLLVALSKRHITPIYVIASIL